MDQSGKTEFGARDGLQAGRPGYRLEFTLAARKLFDPGSDKPFALSRSKVELFMDCPRCFYLDRRLGIARRAGFPFNLNSAVDALLNTEFDHYCQLSWYSDQEFTSWKGQTRFADPHDLYGVFSYWLGLRFVKETPPIRSELRDNSQRSG